MPKNKGKGGKNRRRGKNENEGLKRELVNSFIEICLISTVILISRRAVVHFLKVKRQFRHLNTFWHFKRFFGI